ncbi:DUF1700 domain-containing protein [Paludicola sp. MB14-C6]|uniref:DUF1700 domain-containing protein n=1 Tax=Paludihabitans sp. MB14-C6 TaxID=3070656 RepID=UPI0027DB8D55|nr:DUF1700 domain-containing protein [Paludicola sp. MB14-C6]WMJ21816.1 DUF1700 domain-containing protein [Paludicola sp. MB14-C6]
MLTQDFLYQLSIKLQPLPPQEKDKALSYYAELISDKIENGEQEQDIIASFGNIDELAQSILAENNIYPKAKKKPIHPVIIVLLILFSPVIFGLTVAVASVIFSFLVAGFAFSLSFLLTALALALGGIFSFFTSFFVITANPILCFMQIGASFILLGLAIFFGIGGFYIGKGIYMLTSLTANKVKLLFQKRGN